MRRAVADQIHIGRWTVLDEYDRHDGFSYPNQSSAEAAVAEYEIAAIRAAFAEMKPGMSGPFDECQMLPPSADLD